MSTKPSEISKMIADIARLDPISIGIAIATYSPEEQEDLKAALYLLLKKGTKRIKSDGKSDDKAYQRLKEDAAFIERLRVRLSVIQPERINVPTDFIQVPELLEGDITELSDTDLPGHIRSLISATSCLDTLKTMLVFRTGQAMVRLISGGQTKQHIADDFDLPLSYVERVLNFTRFCEEYPLLRFTGYSFETLLRHKSCIIQAANADDNLRCKLQATGYPRYSHSETKMEVDSSPDDLHTPRKPRVKNQTPRTTAL